ncbi:MAG: protein jag [Chloroflexi bacterium]|nr:protein jag [Chloroflexota bacterium]
MDEVEASGRSVEEAVAAALKQLGVDRSQVEVEVLSEGRSGILGIRSEAARVRVRKLAELAEEQPANEESEQDPVDLASRTLQYILDLLEVDADIRQRPPASDAPNEELATAVLDIQGDDLGILIGRRGETLTSLQYLVNLIISRRLRSKTMVYLDVEGYRYRRQKALQSLALRMAERVKSTGMPVTLEPMPAGERRIVHLVLRDDPDVVTESIGEGESRKVAISPRR